MKNKFLQTADLPKKDLPLIISPLSSILFFLFQITNEVKFSNQTNNTMKKIIHIQKKLSGVCFFLVTTFLFILCYSNSNAQLTGYKVIDNTGAGDYLSVTVAINDLNTQGVGTGGVTFAVNAGQTFTEAPMTITATGTESNPIRFIKNGKTENPKIYGINGTINTANIKERGDAVIKVMGGDFISFSELSFYDSPANTNGTTQMEYGLLFTRRDSDTNACKNISIQFCTIDLNSSNPYTIGIYNACFNSTVNFINPTYGQSDTNKRCVNFYIGQNTINNCNYGIASIGMQDYEPYAAYDQNIHIVNNIIGGIGGSYNVAAFGMDIKWANEITIDYNNVSGGQGTSGQLGAIIGIHTFAYDANCAINNNIVSLGSNSDALYGTLTGIYSGANGITKIYSNEVKNCYGIGAAGPGGMAMIDHYASGTHRLLIYNNNLHDNFATGTSYYMNIIKVNSLDMDSCNIYDNSIHDNGSNSNGFGSMTGIYGANAHNNNIYNNTADEGFTGINVSTTYTSGDTYENNIHDNGPGFGIYGRGNIYRNNIYNLSTLQNRTIYGIFVNGGGTVNVYNNFISRLYAPNSLSPISVAGIYYRLETSMNIYNNTIYLDNSSNINNAGSAAIYESASYSSAYSNIELKNNILVNVSNPGPGGKTIVVGRSNNVLTGYSATSNNNCFYTNAGGYIYSGSTDVDASVGDFKSRVEPAESNSFSENPPFVNAPSDLHLLTNVVTKIESRGIPVTEPVNITHDFDGDVRNPLTPDIGADEFNGLGVGRDAEITGTGYSGINYFTSNTISEFTSNIKNNGTEYISFKIYRKVMPGSYYDSVSINNLSPLKDSMAQFPAFNFTSGTTYTITDSVYLSGDQIPSNNKMSSVFAPSKAKNFVIIWADVSNRDKILSAIYGAETFTNNFDTVNMNTFRGSLHPWKTAFALYGDYYNGNRTWTDKMRDTMKSFLDNSTPSNKKTLLIFGNVLGGYNDGNSPEVSEADSIFYRHYLKANFLNNYWGRDEKGSQYPFWESEQRIKGLGNFSSINGDTAEINGTYSNLITPANGSTAAIIPFTESGDGDSCVAVIYGSESTPYNTFYCSISFNYFRNTSPDNRIGYRGGNDSPTNSLGNIFETITNWVQLPEIGGSESLPVELASFSASVNDNAAKLNWTTVSELNNSGFEIDRRKKTSSNTYANWVNIGFKTGAGTTNNLTQYSFTDNNLSTGKYKYRLKQIDHNGNFKYYELTGEVEIGVPTKYSLSQNYPNPFNPSTKINYDIKYEGFVSLKIYDLLGREIAQLVNENQVAGRYVIDFSSSKYMMASGIYFYRIQAGEFTNTKRMVLVK